MMREQPQWTCYNCGNSPAHTGPGCASGCAALTGCEDLDQEIIRYCEASGANINLTGWPDPKSTEECSEWRER